MPNDLSINADKFKGQVKITHNRLRIPPSAVKLLDYNNFIIKVNEFGIMLLPKENCDETETQQRLEGIHSLLQTNIKGIDRITTITKSLKRFAMPDKGEIEPENINQGIKDTLLILHNQLKHRIEVFENYGKIPKINCNIGQLNQVFMNLILNASQAMDKGKVWIKTWVDNNNIFIEIIDNGNGIPEEAINNIFDPMVTSKVYGPGLGLTFALRIVQEHQGSIVADSEPGKGTKFLITLPVQDLT